MRNLSIEIIELNSGIINEIHNLGIEIINIRISPNRFFNIELEGNDNELRILLDSWGFDEELDFYS